MAVVYADALKIARMQMVIDLISEKSPAPSTGSATTGVLVIGVASEPGGAMTTELASLTLASGVGTISYISPISITLSGMPIQSVGLADGIANTAEIRTSTGNVIVSGLTVGTFGSNIVLTSPSVSIGQPVTIKSASIKHG